MKNKFERLNKNEKKKAIEEFSNSNESNANIISRIKRLKVIGIIGVIYSIGMFILDFLKEMEIFDIGFNHFDNLILNYIIDACLLIFCAFFVIKANMILKEQVNKYLIGKKK
ncbi:MAG: hypothetical protein HFI73_07405 [Bacilli bacterium]|jgi:hypothetical protein|nr:hypothetical protein [Bacilli bacterium]